MTDIVEPTLLLNEHICKSNIEAMASKARDHELQFKPHMKTHQSAEIGHWLADAGVKAITVSSVTMAEYFANNGWNDITIAFPCNIRQTERINQLASDTTLTLLVNNLSTAKTLGRQLSHKVKVYIEIDTGSGRTGLQVSQLSKIKKLINTLGETQNIEWTGFYSHPGHSYSARSKDEIQQVHQSVSKQFQKLRQKIEPDFGEFEVCVGDTPCCSRGTQFEGIDAISPGNFVFYDLMQLQIGSCRVSDIAVAMACPIVDQYSERNELAIHGGAIHFSKEILHHDDYIHFGKVASQTNQHWQILDGDSYLKALSQEHGIIRCSDKVFHNYQIGDIIHILPVHSCLTANLMKQYTLTRNGHTIHQFK